MIKDKFIYTDLTKSINDGITDSINGYQGASIYYISNERIEENEININRYLCYVTKTSVIDEINIWLEELFDFVVNYSDQKLIKHSIDAQNLLDNLLNLQNTLMQEIKIYDNFYLSRIVKNEISEIDYSLVMFNKSKWSHFNMSIGEEP